MSSITTGKVRASFVSVFTPQSPVNGGDPKYSVTLLIPKSDVVTLNAIYREIEQAKQEGIQKVFNGTLPPNVKIPIYDGDGLRPSGEPFGEECHGHMVMRASSRDQPSVVDLQVQPILDAREVYSGCYIRASINFFAYNQGGNRGIGCGLNGVQKVADGEALVSRVSAQEAFGGSNTYPGSQGYNVPGQASAPYQPAAAPAYGQPYSQPAAPAYGQPYSQPAAPASYQPAAGAYDPVTGRPMGGGVMGI